MVLPSKTTLDVIDEIVKIAAVVVAGAWAYLNYVRGRTHRRRLEINLSGALSEHAGEEFFFGSCSAKNVGLSKAPLNEEGSGISLFALRMATRSDGSKRLVPEELVVLSLFAKHGWIEPGETISEPVAIPLPKGTLPLLGVRVDAMISNGKTTWNASQIFERAKPPQTKEGSDGKP
jgi:hypothetical protein